MDYKRYVGNKWEESGKWQIEFVVKKGLKKNHKLLDIGCGSFRGGKHYINYLNKGNYYGIDKHKWLIGAGKVEIDSCRNKKPNLLVNSNFDFSLFNTTFDFAVAISLFSHLTKDSIKQCLDNLFLHTSDNFVLYATIFIGDSNENPKEDNDNKKFKYIVKEIKELAKNWNVSYKREDYLVRQRVLKFIKKK